MHITDNQEAVTVSIPSPFCVNFTLCYVTHKERKRFVLDITNSIVVTESVAEWVGILRFNICRNVPGQDDQSTQPLRLQ